MNLVIDIGNTRIKLALFHNHDLMLQVPLDELKTDPLKLLLDDYPQLHQAILSSVRDYPVEIRDFLRNSFARFIEFDHHTPVPIINLYRTPETLGHDRLAAAIGASCLFPGKDLLVIDAGTAITYDLVTKNNEYLGGNISPGLEMRFKSLHHFTGKLPLICANPKFQRLGKDTESAIRAGVQQGFIFEVEQTIDYFNTVYQNLSVILTGGDTVFLDKNVKRTIFAQFNLALFGLNKVLEYNG
ncbi:MAG: type III pantothenate kinase [Mangrovibacterium sp.]|nr:type III pantothenate kinase [Mangrovibacterium sp.]